MKKHTIQKVLLCILLSCATGCSAISTKTSDVENNISTTLKDSGAVREKNVELTKNAENDVTVLVYMNGSNLESESGEASDDLKEMINAGSSDNVNVVVQTMGTKKWQKLGIASDRSQIYEVNGDGLNLVKDDLGQLDCTDPSSLSSFISWGAENYPADRYILLFWDHGSGPVYGFGYDEFNTDGTLSTDEIQTALKDGGVYFDFIGMDCCIMSSIEVGCAFYNYCDYAILSEDFESGLGWYYTDWLAQLMEDTSISTPNLSKVIIDDMVAKNENNSDGSSSILACIDESMMKVLFQAWTDFAYANEDSLLNNNYSQQELSPRASSARPYTDIFDNWWDSNGVTLEEYYVTDIMAVAQNIESDESQALSSALSQALVYVNATSDDSTLTGLSVTLPYGDYNYYEDLKTVFTNLGIDSTYITWLEKFVTSSSASSYYDYNDWEDSWSGWDDYQDTYDWDDWYAMDEYDNNYWDDSSYWGFDYYDYGYGPDHSGYYY